jgi:hypothetical protein
MKEFSCREALVSLGMLCDMGASAGSGVDGE